MPTDDSDVKLVYRPARWHSVGKVACVLVALSATAILCYQGNQFRKGYVARADRLERERRAAAHRDQSVTLDLGATMLVIDDFLSKVKAGEEQQAYDVTSRDFQRRVSFKDFQALLRRDAHALLRPHRFLAVNYNATRNQPGDPIIYGYWSTDDRWKPFDVTIVRDDGEARIDGWRLRED